MRANYTMVQKSQIIVVRMILFQNYQTFWWQTVTLLATLLRDLEYVNTEQQGTLLIMSLELNTTENDLIIVNLTTKF